MGRDRRKSIVHVLLFLAHVVGKLLAAVDKHNAIIVPVCLSAAHPPSGLLDPDEGPVHIIIGDESCLQTVAEKDTQLADTELVKYLRALIIRIDLGCLHSPVHPCKFLLCHGVCLLLGKYPQYNTWNQRKKQATSEKIGGKRIPGTR